MEPALENANVIFSQTYFVFQEHNDNTYDVYKDVNVDLDIESYIKSAASNDASNPYRRHAFNQIKSDQLAVDRAVPDTRNPLYVSFNFDSEWFCYYHQDKLFRSICDIHLRLTLKICILK